MTPNYSPRKSRILPIAILLATAVFGAFYVGNKKTHYDCQTFNEYSSATQRCLFGEEAEEGFPHTNSAYCDIKDITKKLGHAPVAGEKLSFDVKIAGDRIITKSVKECKDGGY